MADGAGRPLLVLDRVGKGRVAELMSDQTWLWARGFEGGGPQAELLRRLAHWLMKEPELEAESLQAEIIGDHIRITRHTMAAATPQVTLTAPSGKTETITLSRPQEGTTATLSRTGKLDALVPLARRETRECLAEDLRRLDADEIYFAALEGIDKVQYI